MITTLTKSKALLIKIMAPKKKHTSWVVWLRRFTQAFFLFLFFYLFIQTAYHPYNDVGGPVTFFFEIDPLVMTATFVAAHTIPAILLLSLITLGVTFIFGRWFCGWICPFGVLHNFFTSLRQRKVKNLIKQGRFTRGQRIKYYILFLFLGGALLGVNAVGWLDPFSFFYRSLATSIFPAINWGFEAFFNWVYQSDPSIGLLHATSITEPVYEKMQDLFLATKQPAYVGGVLIGLLFSFIVALNFYKARFWCRYICPLGAMLGVVGKNPLVRIHKDEDNCHKCNLCIADCQGGAEPQSDGGWKPSECFYCFNCVDACSTDAITISISKPSFVKTSAKWITNFIKPPRAESINLGRRKIIASGTGGVVGAMLFNSHPLADSRTYNPALIRPPGSVEENDFLAKCVRCGECMKVCPTNGIQPALLQAGLEGMWTPVMNMKLGYCEYECTLCSKVCPTDAIPILTLEERKPIKIGQAFFDPSRCLPYALATPCIVCEEHCPTSPKAIWVKEVEDINSAGETVRLQRPFVDPHRCIGCGICEHVCPLKDRSGIYVTSAGETRNKGNQFLLESGIPGVEMQDSSSSSSDPYGSSDSSGSSSSNSPY
jgi:polyferredoxin